MFELLHIPAFHQLCFAKRREDVIEERSVNLFINIIAVMK